MSPKQGENGRKKENPRGWGARQGLMLPDLQAVGMSLNFIPSTMDGKPLKSFKVEGWHNLIYMLRRLLRWQHGGWMEKEWRRNGEGVEKESEGQRWKLGSRSRSCRTRLGKR